MHTLWYVYRKKKNNRMTSLQKEGLVKYMKDHPNLVTNKFNGEFRHSNAAQLWEECAAELNKLGPAKNANEWKRVNNVLLQGFQTIYKDMNIS